MSLSMLLGDATTGYFLHFMLNTALCSVFVMFLLQNLEMLQSRPIFGTLSV